MMTASIEQLRELAERLEKAMGPSRDVDVFIENTFGIARWDKGPWVPYEGHIHVKRLEPIPVSSSLDAALALAERLLPNAGELDIYINHATGIHAAWFVSLGPFSKNMNAPTPAIAILRALVAALIAQADADHA